MEIRTPYIRYEKNITEDGYKLVCIPYAGRGASYYCGWQKAMGGSVEILPVQLPGRENRIDEECLTDIREAARLVADAVYPYVEKSGFSVFGHSMGGLIAFETVKVLEDRGLHPDICFISSTSFRDSQVEVSSMDLEDGPFLERVRMFGGIDEDDPLFRIEEFRDIFLSILRSDFTMIESYRNDGRRIGCPIRSIMGRKDPMETEESMKCWRDCTEKDAVFRMYEGDHFYIADNLDDLCSYIRGSISKEKAEVK